MENSADDMVCSMNDVSLSLPLRSTISKTRAQGRQWDGKVLRDFPLAIVVHYVVYCDAE